MSWLPWELSLASPGLAELCLPVPWVSSSLSPWGCRVVPQLPLLSTLGSDLRTHSLVLNVHSLRILLPSPHPRAVSH